MMSSYTEKKITKFILENNYLKNYSILYIKFSIHTVFRIYMVYIKFSKTGRKFHLYY